MVDGNELRRRSNGNIDVGGGRWSTCCVVVGRTFAREIAWFEIGGR
jgi:hypothetical protein